MYCLAYKQLFNFCCKDMKNPLTNKIFFNQIWLFGQNPIGYLANFRLVIRLTVLTKITSTRSILYFPPHSVSASFTAWIMAYGHKGFRPCLTPSSPRTGREGCGSIFLWEFAFRCQDDKDICQQLLVVAPFETTLQRTLELASIAQRVLHALHCFIKSSTLLAS